MVGSFELVIENCLTEAEEREARVINFAEEVGGLTQEERDCVRRVAATESLYGAFDPGEALHPVLDCVSPEKLVEKYVADLVGNVPFLLTDDQRDCVHYLLEEMYAAARRAPEDTPMSHLQGFFYSVATLTCFTNDQSS